ncbi:hypothetical protein C7412_112170 [Paraburkholderia silvatlantica]|nr:hypothetical protein C7412_112170 [Paraburkholderia silvatlantica]
MPRVVRFGVAGVLAIGDGASIAWAECKGLGRGAARVSFRPSPLCCVSSRPNVARFLRVATVSIGGCLAAALTPSICGRRTNWPLTFAPVVSMAVPSCGLPARWAYQAA